MMIKILVVVAILVSIIGLARYVPVYKASTTINCVVQDSPIRKSILQGDSRTTIQDDISRTNKDAHATPNCVTSEKVYELYVL